MEDFRVNVPGVDNVGPTRRSKPSRFKIRKFGRVAKIIVALAILLLIAGGYVYQTKRINNLKKENSRLSDPQQAAQQEANRLKSDVAQLIELPNETPTIATVVDVEKLKTQAFFANAQNGDRVLLFPQAKKAILYRPTTKKIIEVAPINIGSGTTNGQSTTTPTSTTPTTKKP